MKKVIAVALIMVMLASVSPVRAQNIQAETFTETYVVYDASQGVKPFATPLTDTTGACDVGGYTVGCATHPGDGWTITTRSNQFMFVFLAQDTAGEIEISIDGNKFATWLEHPTNWPTGSLKCTDDAADIECLTYWVPYGLHTLTVTKTQTAGDVNLISIVAGSPKFSVYLPSISV